MKRRKAEMIMIITVALWGLSFSLTKPILDQMEIFNFMALRFLIGGAVLSTILLLSGKMKVTREQLMGGIVTGVVLFFAFAFHTIGLKYTTVSKNAFIVGSSVIFVPFLATFIQKKKQSKIVWLSTCLAILGLGLVTLNGVQGSVNFGDLMSLAGSFILAYYIILVEEYVQNSDATAIAAIQITTVGILSLIFSLMMETPTLHLSPEGWKSMMFLGLICTAMAYLLGNVMQQYIPATNIALIYTLEPIFAAFFGWIFLSEVVGLQAIIGGIVIIISVALPNFGVQIKNSDRMPQTE